LRAVRRDRQSQRRLEQLCAYLAAHPQSYQATGLADAASLPLTPASSRNPLLQGCRMHSAQRLLTQAVYHRYGQWALARQAGNP
jgi:hypothetical protein